MDHRIAEQVRAKIREALAAQPFRGAPDFDDVVEASATAALHVAHALTVGGTATEALTVQVNSLKARLAAAEAVTDEVKAELAELRGGVSVLIEKGIKAAVASIAKDFDALEARVKAAEELATAPAPKGASDAKAADKKTAKD